MNDAFIESNQKLMRVLMDRCCQNPAKRFVLAL